MHPRSDVLVLEDCACADVASAARGLALARRAENPLNLNQRR